MDHGTENGCAAAAQIAFRSTGSDSLAGDKSARYGSSPANVSDRNTDILLCLSM